LFDEDRSVEAERRERFLWRAFTVSVALHSVIMSFLIMRNVMRPPHEPEVSAVAPPERTVARVYMPPAEELRRMMVPPPPPSSAPRPPVPTAPPTPPPKTAKDRISIGAPSARRVKELWLRPDQEIPKTTKGNGAVGPDPNGRAAALPTAVAPSESERATAAVREPRVGQGDAPLAAPPKPSIMGSLQRLEQKWAQGGTGLGSGPLGPQNVGDMQYDPQGADFTEWINHMTREWYRNFIAPESARMGFRGKVTIQFVFGRDGMLLGDQILESSGTRSLDLAARDAMRASQQQPLPSDYAPSVFKITVSIYFNMDPHRS
jgi:TonB family protein